MASTMEVFLMIEEAAGTPNKFIVLRQEVLLDKRLSAVEKIVCARICAFDKYFESAEACAEVLGLTKRQVEEAKRKLEKTGYIDCISNTGRGKCYQAKYDLRKSVDQTYRNPYIRPPENCKSDLQKSVDIEESIEESITQINEKDAEQDATDNEIKEKLQELDEVNERTDARLKFIEEGNLIKEKYTHKLITKSSYHNLDHYERDTLYLIVNTFDDDTSVFGDQFPLILGGETEPSRFGEQFPFVLDGDNSKPSKFGDPFPFVLDGIFYFKFGDKFPFILK